MILKAICEGVSVITLYHELTINTVQLERRSSRYFGEREMSLCVSINIATFSLRLAIEEFYNSQLINTLTSTVTDPPLFHNLTKM